MVLSPEDVNCRAPLAAAGVRANLKTKKCRLWQLEVRQRSPNGEGEESDQGSIHYPGNCYFIV